MVPLPLESNSREESNPHDKSRGTVPIGEANAHSKKEKGNHFIETKTVCRLLFHDKYFPGVKNLPTAAAVSSAHSQQSGRPMFWNLKVQSSEC
jgi:hypothetical protein